MPLADALDLLKTIKRLRSECSQGLYSVVVEHHIVLPILWTSDGVTQFLETFNETLVDRVLFDASFFSFADLVFPSSVRVQLFLGQRRLRYLFLGPKKKSGLNCFRLPSGVKR